MCKRVIRNCVSLDMCEQSGQRLSPAKGVKGKNMLKGFRERALKAIGARKHERAEHQEFDRTTIAAATLMVELAHLDTDFDEAERKRIVEIIHTRFKLEPEQVEELLSVAEDRHEEAYANWIFTKTIKENFDLEERGQIMTYLWEIALADGELNDLEADLLLRIGQAIDLPENERIKALLRITARLQAS